MISVPRDYQIPDPIGSIEVQLLTETQLMYAVLLDFVDSDSTLLPLCTGHREL